VSVNRDAMSGETSVAIRRYSATSWLRASGVKTTG
jgi:hypothetical protein